MRVKKLSHTTSQYHLLRNNRFWILSFSALLAVIIFLWVWLLVPPGQLQLIRLQQVYGFFGLLYLYLAIIITPLLKTFPAFRYKDRLFHARRALGVSAFFFSLAHVLISFFGQLGGFAGIGFLGSRYALALILGLVGLLVLLAMAATSFDKVIDYMSFPRWKRLHQFVYLASIAILVHVVMIGTHYAYGASFLAWLTFGALLVILILEAIRIDKKLKARFKTLQHFGLASMIMLHILFLGVGFLLGKQGADIPGVTSHSEHGGDEKTELVESFNPLQKANGKTIRINQKQISRASLIDGQQIVRFTVTPAFAGTITSSCFMVNQKDFNYVNGLTKNLAGYIDCLPIGDDSPPESGAYALYLRIIEGNVASTVVFSFEMTE